MNLPHRPQRESAPTVSVICIFYDAQRFLPEAIESVLAQTFQDFELLLVDDGSADDSTNYARAYARSAPDRIRYLEHTGHINRGMSSTRNMGLQAARGKYVAFIDADDCWSPQKLSEQLAVMEAHPELEMVCGSVRYWASWAGGKDRIVPTGHVQDRVVLPPEAALNVYPLGTAPSPCPSDLLLRRKFVVDVGGFEEHFTGSRMMYEDQGFLAKLYLCAPVFFSTKVWLNYRLHAESCVASTVRQGRHHEVKRYFLEWLQRSLSQRDDVDPRVHVAIQRALRQSRHPHRYAVTSALQRICAKARRTLDWTGR